MTHPYKIMIPISSFDRNLLPNPRVAREELPLAIHEYLSNTLVSQGVDARLLVSNEGIRVEWGESQQDLIEVAIRLLKEGKYPEGILILRGLAADHEPEPSVLFNLGMALSDIGELSEAISLLSRYVSQRAEDVDGRIALGVAYARNSEELKAIEVLQIACAEHPSNAFAHRNLGGALLRAGRSDDALLCLKSATQLDPSDTGSWLGLGQAFARLSKNAEADNAFRKVIEIAPRSEIADAARAELTRLAEQSLRANGVKGNRPDAVMYCAAALEKFRGMPDSELKLILAELAIKGQKGYDINNPDKKYRFDCLSGDFTGLQAVSYMFVAADRLMPGQSIGIDLSAELLRAKALTKE
jgi:tetratricopeptide (TPR) repeat protein